MIIIIGDFVKSNKKVLVRPCFYGSFLRLRLSATGVEHFEHAVLLPHRKRISQNQEVRKTKRTSFKRHNKTCDENN